ncbi:Nudix family hydrolase [Pseudomethylobacillus aquaticus]|uniref:8-oxo-dGTP diphosphatase n=1 Tax=Pseudomethylobacillus aquaticus TaxID=2676064 RepID=A0A3N0V173_9PROT|nr:Nudix family hydrolase [Pseudomethylobacillus aquaticus]ROH86352.1 Nudix family hydrolase [Pseudomethylobacillus aquaticus]
MTLVVDAAVAILRRQDGQVLLAQRPEGKPWAGWWEFPGGKIEAGESALAALQRELDEELGIRATMASPWLLREFDYPDRRIRLHFFRVSAWQGEPHGREGQQLAWQSPAQLTVGPMLPANAPILQALLLPEVLAISHIAEMGEAAFFTALSQSVTPSITPSLGQAQPFLLQLREKQATPQQQERWGLQMLELTAGSATRLVVNADVALARRIGAHGVHLPAAQLMQCTQRPVDLLCGASCHSPLELEHAARLGLDYVTLSPVQATRSHPDAVPLGWTTFAHWLADYPLPVYALGGMQPADMQQAQAHHAHGLAMQRAWWRE